jgi:hypothetical protein
MYKKNDYQSREKPRVVKIEIDPEAHKKWYSNFKRSMIDAVKEDEAEMQRIPLSNNRRFKF